MILPFAQVAAKGPMLAEKPLLVLFILGVFALAWGIVSLIAAAQNSRRRREREHTERMRMLEMGFPVPPHDASAWPKSLICIAIGAGVPFMAFLFTYLAHDKPGAADELWVAPGLVSGASVIASSILAGYLFQRPVGPSQGDAASAHDVAGAKPAFDPDAYDVASQRG